MNKERRKQIQAAIDRMKDAQSAAEEAKEILEGVKDDEQEYRDNMPESLQSSEKADVADSAISSLEDADSELDSAIEHADEFISSLENATSSAEDAQA